MNEEPQISETLLKKITLERIRRAGAKRIFWPRGIRLEMLKLFEGGVSTTKLEAVTGISSSVIYKWAQKKPSKKRAVEAGTVEIPASKFSELRIATSEAVPPAELRMRIGNAEIFGFTAGTLSEFLRDAGWTLR